MSPWSRPCLLVMQRLGYSELARNSSNSSWPTNSSEYGCAGFNRQSRSCDDGRRDDARKSITYSSLVKLLLWALNHRLECFQLERWQLGCNRG